jgi:hypothetical protein
MFTQIFILDLNREMQELEEGNTCKYIGTEGSEFIQ